MENKSKLILTEIMFYAPMTRFLFELKIGITFILSFHRRPIQLVVFIPVGLSSFLHLLQVLLMLKFLLSPGLGSSPLDLFVSF